MIELTITAGSTEELHRELGKLLDSRPKLGGQTKKEVEYESVVGVPPVHEVEEVIPDIEVHDPAMEMPTSVITPDTVASKAVTEPAKKTPGKRGRPPFKKKIALEQVAFDEQATNSNPFKQVAAELREEKTIAAIPHAAAGPLKVFGPDEVYQALKSVNDKKGLSEARNLLKKFGAEMRSQLKVEHYSDFVKACNDALSAL